MKGSALLLLCLVDVFPSCGKRPRPTPPPAVVGTVQAPRSVDIKVSNLGFTPSTVSGRPGESLRLNFYYDKSAGRCGREVVVPKDNVRVTLDEKQPVAVNITLPPSGEVTWSCGMDMLHGKIVIE
jgi:plastocyanin domain-containing protein